MTSLACPQVSPVIRYQGDTWIFNISLTNIDGTIFDASAYTPSAVVHVGNTPSAATLGTTSLAQGAFSLKVSPSITLNAPSQVLDVPFGPVFPVRLQVILTDASAAAVTYAIIPIHVVAP